MQCEQTKKLQVAVNGMENISLYTYGIAYKYTRIEISRLHKVKRKIKSQWPRKLDNRSHENKKLGNKWMSHRKMFYPDKLTNQKQSKNTYKSEQT